MFTKKQITENSWLISDTIKPFGFLHKRGDAYQLLVEGEKFEFESYEAVEKQFGKLVEVEKKFKVKDIKGFQPRHTNAEPIEHDTLPLYSSGGNTVFIAGYFALKFENSSWQVVFGPKQKTITDNESIGPFKTRLEALHEVNIKNGDKGNV